MAVSCSSVIKRARAEVLLCGWILATGLYAKPPDPGLGQGWMPEFDMAARQVVALAQAIPADKYGWRPAEGVRSVSEVFIHIAASDLFFMRTVGAPVDLNDVPKDFEKRVKSKPEVLEWLNRSFKAVRDDYSKVDLNKQVSFLGRPSTSGNVMLRLLVHTNEHMGQAVAYARMVGVTPPWSQ